jgi:hypothetical protein
MPNPLLEALEQNVNLSSPQARGVLGILLKKLREKLQPQHFALLEDVLPDVQELISAAPQLKQGLLGNLAGSFGNPKAQLLVEMNQAMNKLGIPINKAKEIGKTLQSAVEKNYPELMPLFSKLDGLLD